MWNTKGFTNFPILSTVLISLLFTTTNTFSIPAFIIFIVFYFYLISHYIARFESVHLVEHVIRAGHDAIEKLDAVIAHTHSNPHGRQYTNLVVNRYLYASNRGFLISIDFEQIIQIVSTSEKCSCEILVAPGDYLYPGKKILKISNGNFSKRTYINLLHSFKFGSQAKALLVDPRIAIRRLAHLCVDQPDLALKAIDGIKILTLRLRGSSLLSAPQSLKKCNRVRINLPNYQLTTKQQLELILKSDQKNSFQRISYQQIQRLLKNFSNAEDTKVVKNQIAS